MVSNISESYPRRIGQGLNDASCILNHMLCVNGFAQSGAGKSRRCCLCCLPDGTACYHHVVSLAMTHRQSACYLHLVTLKLSFTCTSQLKQGWHARSLTRLASVACTHAHHSVSSTDTSTCYYPSISGELLDRHIRMLSSSCDSVDFDMQITIEAGPECTLFNTAGMHAL